MGVGYVRILPLKLRVAAIALAGMIVVVLMICGATSYWKVGGETVPHRFYQTKILLGSGNRATNIDWVDNERMFFYGHDIELPPQTVAEVDDANANKRFLFTWRPGERAKKYPDKGWYKKGWSCAGSGYVSYDSKNGIFIKNGSEIAPAVFKGVLGAEREFEQRAWIDNALKTYGRSSVRFRKSDCSFVVFRESQEINRHWLPFSDDEFYLLFGSNKDSDRRDDVIDIYNAKDDALVNVNIPGLDVSVVCTRYNDFLKTYFSWDCLSYSGSNSSTYRWEQSNCYPIWVIWRTGRARKNCLPFGPWAHAISDIYVTVTQKGLFFSWMRSGTAAAYLVGEDGQARLIRKGHFQNPSVSPDGCKVAAGYFSSFFEGSWIYGSEGQRAAVIDLCVEGDEE